MVKMAVALGSKNVGDIVKINENGTQVNFIVIHKGVPSGAYSTSCDGVWLMREKAVVIHNFEMNQNDYENGPVRSWLENTYYNYFDNNIRSMIKQVKIPYNKGNGTSRAIQTGENGLPSRCFILSATEYGAESTNLDVIGSRLAYFQDCGIEKESNNWKYISDYGFEHASQETRSPKAGDGQQGCNIDIDSYTKRGGT